MRRRPLGIRREVIDQLFKEYEELWPIVIHPTKHGFEGCEWFAVVSEEHPREFVPGILDDDPELARMVWEDQETLDLIGMGDTPNEAIIDLLIKLAPDAVIAHQEMEDEELAAETKMALRDCLSIITLYIEDLQKDNYSSVAQLIYELCEEWESGPNGLEPLVSNLASFTANLIVRLAAEWKIPPEEFLQRFALEYAEQMYD